MRKLWIVLGIVGVLAVGAGGLAAANLGSWVDANRDAVAEEVRARLGREVSFGAIGISFFGGLALRIDDLRVGDDPAFSPEDFLTADAIDVRVKILPALFGRVEVGRIVLQKPSIHVIQTARGLSTESLGAGGAGAAEAPSAEGGAPPVLLVSLLDLRDGTLRWEDRTAKPPVDLRVERLDFTASDVSFTDPVDFELEASLFGAKGRNATVSGTIGPVESEAPRADIRLRLDPLTIDEARRLAPLAAALPEDLTAQGNLSVSLDTSGTLAALSFDARVDASDAAVRYAESFDKPAGRPLELRIAGEKRGDEVALETVSLSVDRTKLVGRATVKNLERPAVTFALRSDSFDLASFGAAEAGAPDALRDLEITGDLALPDGGPTGTLALKSPAGRIRDAEYASLGLDVRMAGQKAEIQKLSADLFGGTFTATGTYDMKGKAPRFDARTRATGMRVETLLESQVGGAPGQILTGELGSKLDLRGAGAGWEQIKPNLTGQGHIAIRDGVLKDFNPAGETLRAVLAIAAFSGSGLARFVERHPKVFGVGDTPFEELTGTIDIRDGWVHVSGLELDVDDYAVTGGGRYSLDNELDFKGQLRLSPALSEEMIAAEPRTRYLRGADGRVELPVAFRGSPPKIAAVPDVSRLVEAAAREAVSDLLGQALGGRAKSEPAPEGDAAPSRLEEETPPPTIEELGGEALRRGLEGLLGGGERE